MLIAHLLSNLLRVSGGKAILLSGLVHAGALALLAQTWMVARVERPHLAGSQQSAISLHASFRATPPPAPILVPAMTVEVTPHVAHAFHRTFVDTPAAAADWEINVSGPTAEPAPDKVAAAPLTRAHETDQRLASEASQPIEFPRARIEPAAPSTTLVVPPMPATNQTSPPEYETTPPPRYPELARQRGWQGTVLLVVKIDATGRVTGVEVEDSSGYQLLDAAAVNAVQRWRYKPAIGRHGPVATEELQPVTFRLPRA